MCVSRSARGRQPVPGCQSSLALQGVLFTPAATHALLSGLPFQCFCQSSLLAQAVMWGWHVPRDLSLLVLTLDALPIKKDCSRTLARLSSHIHLPHLFTGKTFPLEKESLWPQSSLARYAVKSKSEDYSILCLFQWELIRSRAVF